MAHFVKVGTLTYKDKIISATLHFRARIIELSRMRCEKPCELSREGTFARSRCNKKRISNQYEYTCPYCGNRAITAESSFAFKLYTSLDRRINGSILLRDALFYTKRIPSMNFNSDGICEYNERLLPLTLRKSEFGAFFNRRWEKTRDEYFHIFLSYATFAEALSSIQAVKTKKGKAISWTTHTVPELNVLEADFAKAKARQLGRLL